jgi:hypothetical protein
LAVAQGAAVTVASFLQKKYRPFVVALKMAGKQ